MRSNVGASLLAMAAEHSPYKPGRVTEPNAQWLYPTHHTGNFPKKSVCCAPHLRIDPPRGSDRTDKADDFLAESHSRTQIRVYVLKAGAVYQK